MRETLWLILDHGRNQKPRKTFSFDIDEWLTHFAYLVQPHDQICHRVHHPDSVQHLSACVRVHHALQFHQHRALWPAARPVLHNTSYLLQVEWQSSVILEQEKEFGEIESCPAPGLNNYHMYCYYCYIKWTHQRMNKLMWRGRTLGVIWWAHVAQARIHTRVKFQFPW